MAARPARRPLEDEPIEYPCLGTPDGWTRPEPQKIPGGARLMELTPELWAHYACDPALACGHPDCQP